MRIFADGIQKKLAGRSCCGSAIGRCFSISIGLHALQDLTHDQFYILFVHDLSFPGIHALLIVNTKTGFLIQNEYRFASLPETKGSSPHLIFGTKVTDPFVSFDQRMQRESDITHLLAFVKDFALVSPSPVLLAIVNVQMLSPPKPSAA